MTDPASLFRAEALHFRAEDLRHDDPAGSGRPAAVSPQWTARTYWVLLALVAAGLLGSAQMRVAEFARGPAVIRDRVVVAVLPAAFAAELRPGLSLELTPRGQAAITVIVGSTGPELTGAQAAAKLLGTDVTPAGLPPGPVLVVRAAAPPDLAGQQAGTASVQVGSHRLIVTLVTGLAPKSGAGDG
jgi:hypothetical protein